MYERHGKMMSEEVRLTKRQKLDEGDGQDHAIPRSRIFAPYRTLGLVSSTSVPFTFVPLGKKTFQITTSIGRSLQTYDIRKGLLLYFITRPETPENITASIAWRQIVIAAWGASKRGSRKGAWVFQRGKKVAELEVPRAFDHVITKILIVGEWIIGVTEAEILVWKTTTYELHTELKRTSSIAFTNSVAPLPTFINKIIVGRQDGACEIWNVYSGKLLYTILPPSSSAGAVTAIEPTPALDLVAIAYKDATLLIQDVQSDQTILRFDTGEAATSISFRTDGLGGGADGQKAGLMVTASHNSDAIYIWDLNNGGSRVGVLRAAHARPSKTSNGGCSRVSFLPGQAIMVTSGLDNSLKTWIFDNKASHATPRILHQRGGHGATITKLAFMPTGSDDSEDIGKWLVSGSDDRSFWNWSLRRDAQSSEISQGAVESKAKKRGLLSMKYDNAYKALKSPPITQIACSLNRDGGMGAMPGNLPIWQQPGDAKGKVDAEISAMTGWESVVTAHKDNNVARTWLWGRRRAGRWAFKTYDDGNVSAVAMSPCGTFALVGSERGSLEMFNLQSGQSRQQFPARSKNEKKLAPLEAENSSSAGQGRHFDPIVGIGVDEMNRVVISAGAAGQVKFWDFRSGLLLDEIRLFKRPIRIQDMILHRRANLVALTCSDHAVRVVDISTYRMVRELRVPKPVVDAMEKSALTNCVITDDANWLIASMNDVILLWDLPTGHLLDAMKLRSRCTSLAMSPMGDYLATAHKKSLGVELWNNKSLYTHTAKKHIDVETLLQIVQAQPISTDGRQVALLTDGSEDQEVEALDVGQDDGIDALATDMVSLSVVPKSRWQNLLHLDLVRQRNKPIEPPKKPEKAPFFLPSVGQKAIAGSLQSAEPDSNPAVSDSRVLRNTELNGISQFTTLLRDARENSSFDELTNHLKSLGPAQADIEIRSLSALDGEMSTFVKALTWLAQQHRDYELGQAWMAVFLRIHGDIALNDTDLRNAIRTWSIESARESQRVQKIAEYCGGLVGYLRAARV